MKRILFASHDPGGYNIIEPVITEILKNKSYEVFLFLTGPAYLRAKTNSQLKPFLQKITTFPVVGFDNEVDVDFHEYVEVFSKISPDIVFTSTSINSNLERYTLKLAKDFGIKNYAYIDSWSGENIRFHNPLVSVIPDHIFVCDENMLSLYSNFIKDGSSISVVGNIHLEKLFNKRAIRREVDKECIKILFVTENILHYFPDYLVNEFTIIEDIIKNYSSCKRIEIYIRPHPLESKQQWEIFISKMVQKNDSILLFLDNSPTIFAAIEKSDLVVGISSMALIEASILGVPTFSYQIGISNHEMLYIPFELYNIKLINEKLNFQYVIENLNDYNKQMQNFNFPFVGASDKILFQLA